MEVQDQSVAQHARTVLLVDDSAFFRELLAPLIKAAGYRVVAAASAADALMALKSETKQARRLSPAPLAQASGHDVAHIRRQRRLGGDPLEHRFGMAAADVF